MSNFWEGFTKKAGMFDFGLKPEVLEQVKRFNKNVEDLKDVLKDAPGQWERTGKTVLQSGKKLDKKRLFGYAALAGGGLATGGLLGKHFGKAVTGGGEGES